jgi:hypothetical protein
MVYTLSTPQSVIVRVEYVNILGIPRPYFWILVVGIAAAAGCFVIYSVIKRARIPLFLKKTASLRKIIKSKRYDADLVPVLSRNDAIAEMGAGNLAIFNLENQSIKTQREKEARDLASKKDPSQGDEESEV